MSCSYCCRKKRQSYFNPPEIDELMRYPKFDQMPQEDIMAFYMRYRNITKGQPFLNRQQFIEMLNSFNMFPNKKIANRMFDLVDRDQSSQIDFIEFMKYIFLLLDGTKEEKADFIFKMITFSDKEEFDIQDLIEFYLMVNLDDKFDGESHRNIDLEKEQAEEMAKVVFEILGVSTVDTIDKNKFKDFILREELAVDLFNFLNADLESTTKGIKTKRSFLSMINILEKLQEEIYTLEDMFTPIADSYIDRKPLRRKQTKFNLTLQSLLREKILQNFPIKQNNSTKFFTTNFWNTKFQPFKTQKTLFPTCMKETDSNNGKNGIDESEIINQGTESLSNANYPTDANRDNVLHVLNSMSEKTSNLMKMLEKEVEALDKEEKFALNLKQDFKSQKRESDMKKRVFINNPNWNIVTTMISGIHKSLNIVAMDKYHAISKYDFKSHNKIEIEAVYSTQFNKCKFKDYAPYVFQSIRRQYGIYYDAYINSIGVNTFKNAFFDKLYLMLSETSTGKSGSFFFHTSDNKYMIKTIKKEEFDVLRQILPQYHEHILKYPNTLLARYFGLHQIKCYNGKDLIYDIYIVVMHNIFSLQHPELIQHKYDLKGSTYKRYTSPEKIKEGAAKKDLNFVKENMRINVSNIMRDKIINQLTVDANFLSRNEIIDYSLLVGIIKKHDDVQNKTKLDVQYSDEEEGLQQNENNKNNNFIESDDGVWHFYIGIIDTLTLYGMKKKSEYLTKRVFQGKGISCIPPNDYKERFIKFMENAFETSP